jgi:hypothetical protein
MNENIYSIVILPTVEISVWHIPDAVCTVLNSWWWTKRPSETCRVIFNKLEKLCTYLVSLEKYITMHGPMNVKNLLCNTGLTYPGYSVVYYTWGNFYWLKIDLKYCQLQRANFKLISVIYITSFLTRKYVWHYVYIDLSFHYKLTFKNLASYI